MSNSPGIYGPLLPPGAGPGEKDALNTVSDDEPCNVNPSPEQPNLYGPALPPALSKVDTEEAPMNPGSSTSDATANAASFYGPALPPGLSQVAPKIYGPSFPSEDPAMIDSSGHDSDDSDDNIVGPIPTASNTEDSTSLEVALSQRYIEERSLAMKEKLTGKKTDEKLERESWMLELPPEIGKNFGLGPRTFRAKAVDLGDRSVWTETPEDKHKKKNKEEPTVEICRPGASEKEASLRKEVEEYNKSKRPVSLMEIHKEKMKKQKLDGGAGHRRAFDRDTDLATARSDPRAKAKFLSSSQKMADKFQSGQFENKFL